MDLRSVFIYFLAFSISSFPNSSEKVLDKLRPSASPEEISDLEEAFFALNNEEFSDFAETIFSQAKQEKDSFKRIALHHMPKEFILAYSNYFADKLNIAFKNRRKDNEAEHQLYLKYVCPFCDGKDRKNLRLLEIEKKFEALLFGEEDVDEDD
jgi:hypothetical protein